MSPAEDNVASQEQMDESIFLSNMSPQIGEKFNRHYWANLEERIRGWARAGDVESLFVVTGPVYIHTNEQSVPGKVFLTYQVLGPDQVAVPTHFFKVMLAEMKSGEVDVSYTYDTSGRMMTRTSGGVTTRLTWDAWDCVREVTGSSETIYHIPDGMLHSFSLDGVVFQIHSDALGSVRMITEASGAVVARLEYGAWGEEIFVSAIPALANFPYRFVGALGVRTDAVTGLIWMRERWYSPELARFISRDPIGLEGGPNLYCYCGNNPLKHVDPSGLFRLTGKRTKDFIKRVKKRTCIELIVDKNGYVTGIFDSVTPINVKTSNSGTIFFGSLVMPPI